MRRCVFRGQLDLETLVATRGLNFPLSRLELRLMCPTCGNRRVTVLFDNPPRDDLVRAAPVNQPTIIDEGLSAKTAHRLPLGDAPNRYFATVSDQRYHAGPVRRSVLGNKRVAD